MFKPVIDSSISDKTIVVNSLLESSQADVSVVLQTLRSDERGLNEEESLTRRKQYGPNEVAKEKHKSVFLQLILNFKNPLVVLLLVLGLISYLTGDVPGTI